MKSNIDLKPCFFQPFHVVPKTDCPHLGDRAYILVQKVQGDENQQAPCTDCSQTKENWACLQEDCEYVSQILMI
jgi:hypothetical protein